MKNLKGLKRAGALCFACVVLVLFSANAYLQASEGSMTERMSEIPTEISEPEGDGQMKIPDQTEALKQTEISGQTEDHGQTEAPGQTETSGQTEIPDQTEAPKQTEASDRTEAPDQTESPDQAENSDQAETQGQTEQLTEAGDGTSAETQTAETGEDGQDKTAESESESGDSDRKRKKEKELEEVLEAAEEQGIDFLGLAPGESLTFSASIGEDSGIMTMAAQAATQITVTRAASPYRYADYGYGSNVTYKYTVSFRDVTATAYCIQPSRSNPASSKTYKITRLKNAKNLAKVCYYGAKASGAGGFFAEMHPGFNAGQRFIITHLAASFANGSSDAFSGANQKAQNLAHEMYEYCMQQADIPDVEMELSDTNVSAYVNPEYEMEQRTKEITFQASETQTIRLDLPAGVALCDLTNGIRTKAGESVTIKGGTRFYLMAPLDQAVKTGEVWSATMKGSVTKDYSAYKITTGAQTQDLALVFADGIEDPRYVDLSVRWLRPIDLTIDKTDVGNGNPLEGVVFGLFADPECTRLLLELPPTDAQGRVHTTVYKMQDVVYLREIFCRNGYACSARLETLNLKEAEQNGKGFSYNFTNERVKAKILLKKQDAQTEGPQGDGSLQDAVYGLYAREDIVHPDGSTGVLFHAGEQVASMRTDENGEAAVGDLYLGKYYIKEITPSPGYLLDEKEYDILLEDPQNGTEELEAECISEETVIRQPFRIIKIAGNRKENADPLEGAGFTAYLASSLKVGEDGAYDFASADPVVLGENGETEIFTDKDGCAESIALPFGTYIVRETTVPEGYEPVEDFEVRITENNPTEPQPWRVLIDKEFEAKLKIIKTDDETQRPILAANTEFRVYDIDAGEYVEQVTTYPKEEKHSSYYTDEEGWLILPQSLPRGHYRIEEVKAPDGYTLGETTVDVTIDKNMAYRMSEVSDEAIVEAVASNHPVKGELRVIKKGEVLKDHREDFVYEEEMIPKAVFEVYAAEDIYTADLQKDENGNRFLEYAQGAKVGEMTTGEQGEAVMSDLPLGKYRVVEKSAPEGYVHSSEEQYAQLVYVDQETPVVSVTLTYVNRRQKAEITVLKRDIENGNPLAGAEFGLFAKEDIEVNGEKLVGADEQIASAVSGDDGRALFEQDIPFGNYYIKELRAPDGYLPTDKRVDLSFSYEGQNTEVVLLEAVFNNESTVTEFTKSDLTTGTELDGATLTILDSEGNVIESWVSAKDSPHMVRGLHVGETYRLREELAPYGYLRAEEVEFTIGETGEVQKVKMEDDVPVGRIIISKTGEFVDSVTWNQMVAGSMEAVFGYVSGTLKEVVFEVHAAEDIRAADGVSGNYYAKDELVETITTDELGYARSGDLPLGKYYVVEKKTAEGYVLDDKPREVDLTYRDQDTPIVTYDEKWQNRRQKVRVSVLKREKESGRALAGGIFALCAGEDIVGNDGTVLLKADAVIEQKATGEDGRLAFTADLPLGGSYYVKEIKAPAGFVTTGESREFHFTYVGEDKQEAVFDFTFENQPTQVKISKADITTGDELPGAKLQLRNENGDLVDQWTSGPEPHMIEGLEADKIYTLREESAPKGYVIAEEIRFRVRDTGKVQKVVMKDACPVGKVIIHKTDRTTGKAMKGVEFVLRDEKGRTLEKLVTDEKGNAESKEYPITGRGKDSKEKTLVYTLKESRALKGYKLDETEHKVKFSYKNDRTPVVECRFELKNEKEDVGSAPKTGDETDFLLPGMAAALSGCAVLALAFARRRKKKLS